MNEKEMARVALEAIFQELLEDAVPSDWIRSGRVTRCSLVTRHSSAVAKSKAYGSHIDADAPLRLDGKVRLHLLQLW